MSIERAAPGECAFNAGLRRGRGPRLSSIAADSYLTSLGGDFFDCDDPVGSCSMTRSTSASDALRDQLVDVVCLGRKLDFRYFAWIA